MAEKKRTLTRLQWQLMFQCAYWVPSSLLGSGHIKSVTPQNHLMVILYLFKHHTPAPCPIANTSRNSSKGSGSSAGLSPTAVSAILFPNVRRGVKIPQYRHWAFPVLSVCSLLWEPVGIPRIHLDEARCPGRDVPGRASMDSVCKWLTPRN